MSGGVLEYRKENCYRYFEQKKSNYIEEIVELIGLGSLNILGSLVNSGLFELYKYYSYIGLNAPRQRIGDAYDVEA